MRAECGRPSGLRVGEGNGVVLVHGHVEADFEAAGRVVVHARLTHLALLKVADRGDTRIARKKSLGRSSPAM